MATKPKTPQRDGYGFHSWNYDNKEYDFNLAVSKDLTIVATWEKIQEGLKCPNGYEIFQGKCRKLVSTLDATKKCQSGYSLSGSNCAKTTSINPTYSCQTGYTQSDNKCLKYDVKPLQ